MSLSEVPIANRVLLVDDDDAVREIELGLREYLDFEWPHFRCHRR